MVARLVVGVAVVLVVAGLALGVARVSALESAELEHVSEPVTLSPTDGEPHREITRVRLDAGEDVTFEVCAPEPFSEAWTGALEIAVWDPATQELLTRTALDADRLGRAHPVGVGECVVVAQGNDLAASGEIALEAVWAGRQLPPEVTRVPLRGHVVAHRPIAPDDRWPVWGALCGAVLGVLGVAGWRGRAPAAPPETAGPLRDAGRGSLARVGAGLLVLAVASVAAGFAPLYGSTAGLSRGLLLAAVQIVAAVALVSAHGESRAHALGIAPPSRWWALALAPVVGVALWALGGLLVRWVPSTGTAPIESFVEWPSGTLAVALVAVVVPVAEELFFRGFVYGTIERSHGARAAFAASVLLFAAAHLPQVWNAWGAFSAILLTGLVLTALRARTSSVLVPALAHLAYNGVNVVLGLAGGP